VLLAIALWLLTTADGNATRRVFLGACFIVVYLRLTGTVFILLKRSMGWDEAVSVALAFALYYVGFTLLGRSAPRGVGALEIVGLALFVGGSLINTLSEILRYRWKRDPAHKGRLYTGGLFRYSVHINYFGDILWVIGISLVTANPWSLIIPAFLFSFFAFYNAPALDRHLEEKYGDEFREYSSHTAKLVPFIF
jgi:steroid 5-alpha reductase family enzyme